MADPLSTADLYGISSKKEDERIPVSSGLPPQSAAKEPLVYEETPVITPDMPEPSFSSPPPPTETTPSQSAKHEASFTPAFPSNLPKPGTVPKRPSSCIDGIGTIIFFIGMFIVGIWLSSFLRQFSPSTPSQSPSDTVQTTPTTLLTPTTAANNVNTSPFANWKTYTVLNGITRQPISGISFQLPPDTLPPVCDGVSCASQGTYLPGGTRFTVAPRGGGQVLKDYRGNVISDVGGIPFTVKSTTVGGLHATEFTGIFTGRTVSGYAFSQMHGVMIDISDTLSLEVNHFVPSGITADFATDDSMFGSILQTFVFPSAAGTKGGIIPYASPSAGTIQKATPTPTKTSQITPTTSY